MNLLRSLSVVSLCLVSLTAHAGVMLTANAYDTPGLPGYQTFDLTASSSVGYVNGFDFVDGELTGPMHQGSAPSDDPWASYGADKLFGGLAGDAADSHWLVDSSDGFAIQSSQSDSELAAAFVFSTSSGLRDTYRSLPFARIVTNNPSAVSLGGEFLVEQYWSDGGGAGATLFDVNTLLSEISTGGAPVYTTFPDRPTPPVVEPPVVTPPAVTPPLVELPTVTPPVLPESPVVDPPVVTPPVVEPIEPITLPVEPPVYELPTVTVEGYQNQLTDRQAAIQKQIDALKAEQESVNDLLAASEEPGFVPPANGVIGMPYRTRWPVYPIYQWPGTILTIDVVDTTAIDLTDYVSNRGVMNSDLTFTNFAYDGDASSLAFTANAVTAFDVVPEPAAAVLALVVLVGVQCRRSPEV